MGPSHSSGSILHTRINNLLCERGSNGPVMVITLNALWSVGYQQGIFNPVANRPLSMRK